MADEPDDDDAPPAAGWPTVPDVPNRRGRTLGRALFRTGLSRGCGVGCCVVLVAGLGFLVWRYAGPTLRTLLQGNAPDLWPAAWHVVVSGLLALAVLALIVAVLRWVAAGLAGQIAVEVEPFPVRPGRPFRVSVASAGVARLTVVGVKLVCTEAATYTQGTNTTTEEREVADHPVAEAGGSPWLGAGELPADAMHSFEAKHNKVSWAVRVTGRVLGVKFEDDYAVCVRPG